MSDDGRHRNKSCDVEHCFFLILRNAALIERKMLQYTTRSLNATFFLKLGVLQSSFLASSDDATLWLLQETN